MANELAIFEKEEFGSVRVTDQNGEPWFVAKDVCDILGLESVGKALSSLDKSEKNTVTINHSIRGNPKKAIINESGLYSLILRSRKPKAKEFRLWITSEVIPSIRKTGAFLSPDLSMDQIEGLFQQVLSQATKPVLCLVQHMSAKLIDTTEKLEVSEERVKTLEERLGESENWMRASAIPWLFNTFSAVKIKENKGTFYQSLGRELSKIARLSGHEKKYLKTPYYKKGIGVYFVDTVDALKEELSFDPNLLKEWRKTKIRKRKQHQQLELVC